jgi:hypothetical protein
MAYARFWRYSGGKSCGSGPGLAWLMRGRMGKGWVGRQPRPFTLRKSENYISAGVSKSEIARRVRIERTSVCRILGA